MNDIANRIERLMLEDEYLFELNTEFKQLGLDSLDFVDFVCRIEEEFGILIQLENVTFVLKTPNDFVTYLESVI